MNNQIDFNPIALDKLAAGVDKLARAVKVTLGPKGRNVVINTVYGAPVVTKDGVTVAGQIFLEDPVENLGAQIAKQAAARTSKIAGDGTTTATILVNALVSGSLKLIRSGVSPIDIKRGFEVMSQSVLSRLKALSKPVNDEDIKNIATISANNDEVIGELLYSAFTHVGKDGVITMEDSRTDETYVTTVDGYNFDKGYLSPYFVTDPVKMETIYENPLILVTDMKIRFIPEIKAILEECLRASKPIIIIADEVEGQALGLMVVNRMRTGMPIVAIKAPAYGERRGAMLQDIATATGATLISESSGHKLENVKLSDLGTCRKIIVHKDETFIVDTPESTASAIEARIESLKEQLGDATDGYTSEKTMERIAKLKGKVAVVFVGAPTETELKEKKARIDDALRATRAAIQHGYVVGGGTVLAKMYCHSEENDLITKVFYEALKEPLRTIASNAGVSADIILDEVLRPGKDFNYGYNAHTDKFEDLIEGKVIDPALVVSQCVTNAVSAASMIILSDCVVYSKEPNVNITDIGNEYDS